MVYLEFIDWHRSTPVDVFHHLVKQDGWLSPEDECVINIGRHKGLAEGPSYLCAWRIRELARMDEWEVYFKSPEGLTDYAERAAFQALSSVRCALYDELKSGALDDTGFHFVEYFNAGPDISDDNIRDHFLERDERQTQGSLVFVLRKIGLLGPAVGDIAIWTFPSFAAIEPIAREKHSDHVLSPNKVGLYRNVGEELM